MDCEQCGSLIELGTSKRSRSIRANLCNDCASETKAAYMPTPEEIAEATRLIRESLTPRELAQRRVTPDHKPNRQVLRIHLPNGVPLE